MTLRNNQHPFHSNAIAQTHFNDVTYNNLKQSSRFNEKNASPDLPNIRNKEEVFFDIKGNTFKNTLIPEETANNLYVKKQMSQTTEGFARSASNSKMKPQYKGYVRSGQLLFNNFGQKNTWDEELPTA